MNMACVGHFHCALYTYFLFLCEENLASAAGNERGGSRGTGIEGERGRGERPEAHLKAARRGGTERRHEEAPRRDTTKRHHDGEEQEVATHSGAQRRIAQITFVVHSRATVDWVTHVKRQRVRESKGLVRERKCARYTI